MPRLLREWWTWMRRQGTRRRPAAAAACCRRTRRWTRPRSCASTACWSPASCVWRRCCASCALTRIRRWWCSSQPATRWTSTRCSSARRSGRRRWTPQWTARGTTMIAGLAAMRAWRSSSPRPPRPPRVPQRAPPTTCSRSRSSSRAYSGRTVPCSDCTATSRTRCGRMCTRSSASPAAASCSALTWQPADWTCPRWTGSCSLTRPARSPTTCIVWAARHALASRVRRCCSCCRRRPAT
mmetsp:Transcript_27348/g.38853  ORF Transcript_27348/g.38853 Transcript_27348/m.38853 type:complete len:239 (+) Transcript_27348:378-1094(+)